MRKQESHRPNGLGIIEFLGCFALTLLLVIGPAHARNPFEGPPCGTFQRFVVSEDGTEVCDNTTGLIWQQTPDNSFLGQVDAIALCPTLGAGYRLSEIKELISLVDYSQFNPALPTDHPFSGVVSGVFYWSASTEVGGPQRGWAVDLSDGNVSGRVKTNSNFVWCVRQLP